MAIRTYKVTLDSKNSIAPEPVFLRQGDKTGAVVIDATLMDNGSPVSLSELTPIFKANTADGQAVIADSTGFNIVDASAGEFTYQVPNALSAVPGKITTAYFSFSDSSGSESTFDVAFIIKKAVDATQAQADDYITIVDGTLQSLQQKIDAMNTDVQTILNAYNQGDFYNKSQTDSKDAATLASAKAYADTQDATVLTSVTTEMEQGLDKKVDKGGGGQITLPMLSTDVKTAMTGGSVAVVGKNAVLAENIVKDTITPDEVGFVSRAILSNTLVDDTKIQKGGYYDYTNGAWIALADYKSTGLIPCAPDQSYTRFSLVGQITYYDKNGSFVVGDNPSQTRTFKVPNNSNISYMRLAFGNAESIFTVNSGTELLEKDLYKEEFSIDLNLDIDNKIKDLEIDVSEIKDNTDELMPVIISNNLVDKSIVKFGGYYDFKDGTWKDRTDINSTGFISCNSQDTFIASASGNYVGGNATFWNKKGEYVSGIDVSNANGAKTSFTVPENDDIESFKMSFYSILTDSYMINKGIDILPYDEYKMGYVSNKDIVSPNIKLIEESLQEIKTTLGITLQSLNSIGDISTMQYRAEDYKTTFWLTKINRDTFDGGKIKPKVRLTSSSVDSGDPKSVLDYITNHDEMCCINAGVFDVTSGIVDGRLIIDGAIQQDSAPVIHQNQWTLGIKSDGSLSAYDSTISASAMLTDGCESAVTGFVPIIMNGSMVDKSLFLTFGHLTQPNPRQVICQTALGDYLVLSCDGRKDGEEGLTLEQIGEILLSFGVTFAYNLDGGGSTQTFVKKRRVNRLIENRPIPSIIVFE